ncbi:MAG: hypothetical protein ACKOXP_03760 [Flavobacteriales bacterium]
MKFVALLLSISIAWLSFAQSELQQKEQHLNESLLKLRNASTDNEMDRLNTAFKKEMEAFLKSEGAFDYPFSLLKTVAILDSQDELLRIINWNIEYTDFSYSYAGFILKKEEGKDKVTLTEMIDKTDPYTPKPEGIIEAKNWYGALYYKIIPFGHHGKTEYLLIGWDGGTTGSNFKLMDVLTFSGNSPRFGSPVFKANRSTLKRVVYEYSNQSNMTMRFDEKNSRVVFDHLSPESPSVEGLPSFYIPDMTYDAYHYDFDAEIWVLQEDVIMTNPDDKNGEKSFYSLNTKTGKVEKNRMNADWISPQDPAIETNGTHVARTGNPTEDQAAEEDLQMPRVRLFTRRHKNPEMMAVKRSKKNKKITTD